MATEDQNISDLTGNRDGKIIGCKVEPREQLNLHNPAKGKLFGSVYYSDISCRVHWTKIAHCCDRLRHYSLANRDIHMKCTDHLQQDWHLPLWFKALMVKR